MMDGLSALKMLGTPDLGGPLNQVVKDASAPKPIESSDLDKLKSAMAQSAPLGVGSSGASFQNLLTDFAGEVNQKQTAATDAISGLMSGKNVSLHQAMISMEEANVSFQMMVEVRNKLLDSYQELMRMQV
jgi:flagellar hook-basal body complex protein FliE